MFVLIFHFLFISFNISNISKDTNIEMWDTKVLIYTYY